MKFFIGHKDNKNNLYWRKQAGPVAEWQPFKAKADYYDLEEVIEIMALAKELLLGETLIVERVIGSGK